MPNIRILIITLTLLLLTACAELPFQSPNIANDRSIEPETAPIPRLETGGHTAMIRRISVDHSGRWLITASDDKTARVWNLRTGELVQVMRPPIGSGAKEGMLFAVAISPDGETVAAGGWTRSHKNGNHIYIFDRASGDLRRVIADLPDAVFRLVWSPDGRHLAATLGSGGLRVYDTANWHEAYSDIDYGDSSYGADFSLDGRLITTCRDGRLRLYNPDGDSYVRSLLIDAPSGEQPYAAAFSPDGLKIAVGYLDKLHVDVLDAATLSRQLGYARTNIKSHGRLPSLTWSRDGQTLYAAGQYDQGNSKPPFILRWTNSGKDQGTIIAQSINSILDIIPLSDGGLAISTADTFWGVISPYGQAREFGNKQIIDFQYQRPNLLTNHTGTQVQFDFRTLDTDSASSTRTACFELTPRKLITTACSNGKLNAANTGGQPRSHWFDTYRPKFGSTKLELAPDEKALSLDVSQHGFVLGAEWSVYAFERDGTQRWRQPLPGIGWAVNVSGDGRFVIVATGDGTLRWYADRSDRSEEILALYVHPDGKHWIAWTPQGFFDASGPDAEELFGFHINRGSRRAGEFVRASQLRERFLNPELIAHRLDADGDERLARAVEKRGAISVALQNAERIQLTRRSPATVQSVDGELRLEFALDRPLRAGEKLVVRVDGKEVDAREADDSIGKQFIPLPLTLAPGQHRVETAARNTQQVDSEWIETRVEVAPRTLQRGLHVIAVGISRYYDSSFDLRYAASDANAFVDAIAARAHAPAFPRGLVTRKVLIDGQARRENILQVFADLAASPALRPEDTIVVYLAGHGLSRDGDYRFIPHELQITNADAIVRQALDGDTLRSLLRKLPADTLIVLDTCNAGAALPGARGDDAFAAKEQLQRTVELSGRAFLTATGPKTLAMEGYREHGYFTYALLEGLEKTDLYEHGQLTVDRLWSYAYNRLVELTAARGFRQVPMRDAQNRTFPIAGPRR